MSEGAILRKSHLVPQSGGCGLLGEQVLPTYEPYLHLSSSFEMHQVERVASLLELGCCPIQEEVSNVRSRKLELGAVTLVPV